MGISRAAVKLVGNAAQSHKNRDRCIAKHRGKLCNRPVKKGWPHCGRAACAVWVFEQDAA